MVWLNDDLSIRPGIGPVFRLVRTRRTRGKATTATTYGITSRTRAEADAKKLLHGIRAHGAIEDRLHDTRDVTFGGDRGRVRRGHAPRVLASFRNVARHLPHNTPHTPPRRHRSHHPQPPTRTPTAAVGKTDL